MCSSILWEKNCQIFPLRGHLPQNRLFEPCFSGCLVIILQTWLVFKSKCPFSLIVNGPRMCLCLVTFFVYESPFWTYFMLKVSKIYSSRLCLLFHTVAYIIICQLYQTTAQCKASSHGQQNTQTRIHGMTADPIFAAGFSVHCGRHRDDCNFSSLTCATNVKFWS